MWSSSITFSKIKESSDFNYCMNVLGRGIKHRWIKKSLGPWTPSDILVVFWFHFIGLIWNLLVLCYPELDPLNGGLVFVAVQTTFFILFELKKNANGLSCHSFKGSWLKLLCIECTRGKCISEHWSKVCNGQQLVPPPSYKPSPFY